MAAKLSLDSFDQKILDCLQDDADMALAEIARRVGLSTTPCWRRINRLQEPGIIRARVALLDRKAVNAGVTVFVAVRTAQHNAQWLGRFAKAVASFPEVMDCYRMSGEIDYLIRLALPDIDAYDAFYKRLIAKIELSDVTSMFAMEEIKSTTRLPLNYLPSLESKIRRTARHKPGGGSYAVSPAHGHAQERIALPRCGSISSKRWPRNPNEPPLVKQQPASLALPARRSSRRR